MSLSLPSNYRPIQHLALPNIAKDKLGQALTDHVTLRLQEERYGSGFRHKARLATAELIEDTRNNYYFVELEPYKAKLLNPKDITTLKESELDQAFCDRGRIIRKLNANRPDNELCIHIRILGDSLYFFILISNPLNPGEYTKDLVKFLQDVEQFKEPISMRFCPDIEDYLNEALPSN